MLLLNGLDITVNTEQITFSEASLDPQELPLRSRAAVKIQTGDAHLELQLSCFFNYRNMHRESLLSLLADLKTYPWAVVESDDVRMPQVHQGKSTWACKNMTMLTVDGQPEMVQVQMVFVYFNHAPFSADFLYRWELGEGEDSSMIAWPRPRDDSRTGRSVWSQVVQAARQKWRLGDNQSSSVTFNIPRIEFKEDAAVRELPQELREELGVLVGLSSLPSSEELLQAALKLDQDKRDVQRRVLQEFSELTPIKVITPAQDQDPRINRFDNPQFENTTLQRTLCMAVETIQVPRKECIVTGISLSFMHHLSIIPMRGYSHPTVQWLGGSSTAVSISVVGTMAGIEPLMRLYETSRKHKYALRNLPPAVRETWISNEILGLMGVEQISFTNKTVQTVPSQPGTFVMTMEGTESGIAADAVEQVRIAENPTKKFWDAVSTFILNAQVKKPPMGSVSRPILLLDSDFALPSRAVHVSRVNNLIQQKDLVDVITNYITERDPTREDALTYALQRSVYGQGWYRYVAEMLFTPANAEQVAQQDNTARLTELRRMLEVHGRIIANLDAFIGSSTRILLESKSGEDPVSLIWDPTFEPELAQEYVSGMAKLPPGSLIDDVFVKLDNPKENIAFSRSRMLPLLEFVGKRIKGGITELETTQVVLQSKFLAMTRAQERIAARFYENPQELQDIPEFAEITSARQRAWAYPDFDFGTRIEPDAPWLKDYENASEMFDPAFAEQATRIVANYSQNILTQQGAFIRDFQAYYGELSPWNKTTELPTINPFIGNVGPNQTPITIYNTRPTPEVTEREVKAVIDPSQIRSPLDAGLPAGLVSEASGNAGASPAGVVVLPMGSAAHIITSWIQGSRSINHSVGKHSGTDFGAPEGTELYAVVDAEVRHVGFQPTGAGNFIILRATILGELYDITYMHMRDAPLLVAGQQVSKGTPIGRVGNTGRSTGAHLHFEIRRVADNAVVVPFTESQYLEMSQHRRVALHDGGKLVVVDASPSNATPLPGVVYLPLFAGAEVAAAQARSDEALGTNHFYNTQRRMNRSMPTMHLTFVAEHGPETFMFSDYFAWSSVLSFELHRSRDICADLLHITFTNVAGMLSNREYEGMLLEQSELDDAGRPARFSHKIRSLFLQPGIKILLRMGYTGDILSMAPQFVGRIATVEPQGSDEVLEVVAQSLAAELQQQVIMGEEFTNFISDDAHTRNIFYNMLARPEVVSFGFYKRDFFAHSHFDPQDTGLREVLQSSYRFAPETVSDNIFVPNEREQDDEEFMQFMDADNYVAHGQTIWDVCQEMTLRHPGFIFSSVPYQAQGEEEWRYTAFFGLPNFRYISRDPNFGERDQLDSVVDTQLATEEARKVAQRVPADFVLMSPNSQIEVVEDLTRDTTVLKKLNMEDLRAGIIAGNLESLATKLAEPTKKSIAVKNAVIKPFRSYHVASSRLNLVSNNIRAEPLQTYNAITVTYSDDAGDAIQTDQGVGSSDWEEFTLCFDESIPEEERRQKIVTYPNCQAEEMAARYAVALLMDEAKRQLSGEITLLGNPDIKPYDSILVADEITDMFGPVDVRSVTHYFSHDTGFLTVVEPDQVVRPGLTSLLPEDIQDALYMSYLIHGTTHGMAVNERQLPELTAVGWVYNVWGNIGQFFGAKHRFFISNMGYPVITTPLLYRGRPFVSHYSNNLFQNEYTVNPLGTLFQEGVAGTKLFFKEGWREFDITPDFLAERIKAVFNTDVEIRQ